MKAEQLNDQMQDDRAQLEADIRATERELRSAKGAVEKALSASPFSGASVIAAEDKVVSVQGGLDRLKLLLTEEFGD